MGACRLEVSRGDGNVITQPVIFDYKVNPNSERAGGDDGGCAVPEGGDRVELKNTLLQKLEVLCDKMRETDDAEEGGDGDASAAKIAPPADAAAAAGGDVMEDVLVSLVDRLTQKVWKTDEGGGGGGGGAEDFKIPEFMTQKYRGMTILHLAASLGYATLTASLLRWSADNPVLTLQTEIDALAQDSEGFTPLVSCSMANVRVATADF